VLFKILVLELKKQLIRNLNDFININVFLNALQMLEDNCKLIVDDHFLAGHYDSDGEEADKLKVIFRRKDAFPNS
jgi:hypothetical protein